MQNSEEINKIKRFLYLNKLKAIKLNNTLDTNFQRFT